MPPSQVKAIVCDNEVVQWSGRNCSEETDCFPQATKSAPEPLAESELRPHEQEPIS